MHRLSGLMILLGGFGCASLTPENPSITKAFQAAAPQYLAQQADTFSDESSEDRVHRRQRYIYGMSTAVKQIDTLLKAYKVAERSDYEVDPEQVLFGTPSVSDRFSRHSLFHHKQKDGTRTGMTLDEVLGYLESETIEPSDIPIHVIKVNEQIIAINNHDLAVLGLYGAPPAKIVKHSLADLAQVGMDSVHMILTELERMPMQRGSRTIYIRGKGVGINGEAFDSYALEAPFVRLVNLDPAKS